jgi:DNA-binding MarR family transcriptional regulator
VTKQTAEEARRAGLLRAESAGGYTPQFIALTDVVLLTFRLNGLFLAAAEGMTKPARLTAARWQVLGAVLRQPLTVSAIARAMGLTRQAVQRLADALVADGMAEYADNPAHRRSKLLQPTAEAWAAIDVIRPRQQAWARAVTKDLTAKELQVAVTILNRVVAAVETVEGGED